MVRPVWGRADVRKPALKHSFYFLYGGEVAPPREGERATIVKSIFIVFWKNVWHIHTVYLPHIWILKDGHYSLDALNGDALLEAAETWRRTPGEQSCLRALTFCFVCFFSVLMLLLLVLQRESGGHSGYAKLMANHSYSPTGSLCLVLLLVNNLCRSPAIEMICETAL